MKTRFMTVVFAAFFYPTASMAGTLSLTWSTNKAPASYRPAEPMTFKVQLVEDGQPLAGKMLKWLRTGDDRRTATGTAISSKTRPLEITTALDKPGFVHLEITVCNQDGSPLKEQPVKFEGGAGVEPAKLEGYPEPADFDAFWRAQKARLAQVPMKASLTEAVSRNSNFQLFDVKVDCAGGKPVSGYLAVPKDAKAKSLPAQVSFQGYDVCSAYPDCHDGMIALQINAHGIENGHEREYYQALREGKLKNYAFSHVENAKPETAYFNGMMLRVMRALEFIKSRPEWDGKTLIVSGVSQGGLQSLTAAALDGDVTECIAYRPWCCDLGGIKLGRLRGWRPDFADGLAYYDAANMAKRIKCKTFISAGLGDPICPPSGLSVLYNNLRALKTIEYIQGATHGYNPPNPMKQIFSSK